MQLKVSVDVWMICVVVSVCGLSAYAQQAASSSAGTQSGCLGRLPNSPLRSARFADAVSGINLASRCGADRDTFTSLKRRSAS